MTTSTRQSRKGAISSWKAFAPAFAGKVAIEAVDRAMRGEGSPAPIYEGEDGVIAWLLGGPSEYHVPLPAAGEPKRAILDSYTKEHSAEYQSQAPIDLARRSVSDRRPEQIEAIVLHTSHHTHYVIGTGSNDPEKFDPDASRETLDHSLPYIFAVALAGRQLAPRAFLCRRAGRPTRHHRAVAQDLDRRRPRMDPPLPLSDPAEKAFGARTEVRLRSGEVIVDELAVADAHPLGARPFDRAQYVQKFNELAGDVVEAAERERFLAAVDSLADLRAGELGALNVRVDARVLH